MLQRNDSVNEKLRIRDVFEDALFRYPAKLEVMWTLIRTALILMLLASGSASAKIYKWILPDGSVTYSDQPQVKGAAAVELPPLQTYSPPSPPAAGQSPVPKLDLSYNKVEVVTPKSNETLRDNGGTISVQLAIEPPLNAGHEVEILVDGKSIGRGRATSASVSNLDRGSHTISATIKDANGKVIKSASSVTFHLQRSSKLQPQRAPPS